MRMPWNKQLKIDHSCSLQTLFIFAILNSRHHMVEGAPNGSLVLVTPSVWMTSELFHEVFIHFIKHINVSKNNPVVLVMDNHKSHLIL